MKRISASILAAIAGVALVSCEKNNGADTPEPSGSDGTMTFQAQLTPHTKVNMDASMNLTWKYTDCISVADGKSLNTFEMVEGSSTGAKASFKGKADASAAHYWSAYPASSVESFEGESFTMYIPTKQTLESHLLIAPNALMGVADATKGGTFTYRNFTGLMKVELDSDTKDVVFRSMDDQMLGGKVSVKATDGSLSLISGGKTITIVPNGRKGDCYIALMPGTYKGFKAITTTTSGETVTIENAENFEVKAGGIVDFGKAYKEPEPEPVWDIPAGSVHGYVRYTDTTPAEGVSVSDGFSVVVTDAKGHYILPVSSDAMYIYVSIPSNGNIERDDLGRPVFFKAYEAGTQQYDFGFRKITPESEFYMFTLADPQAHYAKRSPQTKADTDRFRDESVPAMNNEAASLSLPVYGVTLGDIVYSEGTRNSNAGLAIMRSHMAKLSFPLFQVMGNHDYTFYTNNAAISTSTGRSTINLVAQKKMEETFGPINYSFNRGDVHFICMKNVHYLSTTTWMWSNYEGNFTEDQIEWLKQDLANVPTSKKVILCVHIPIYGITTASGIAQALALLKKYPDVEVFSGHTHYGRNVTAAESPSGRYEHVHSAVCGQWWWSNISGDGCPNGYGVFRFKGTKIVDNYFIGVNEEMNKKSYQMRVYRGNLKTGGSYAYFQWPYSGNVILINVFNASSAWKVKVYEDGTYTGNATLMPYSRKTWNSVTAGQTYDVGNSNQDWWSIGYHIGAVGRGTSNSTSYYTSCFHMYQYQLKNASAKVKVEATDEYGNVYTCTDVIETATYPEYIRVR